MLPPENILPCPHQPRLQQEESALCSLTQSLRENGMMQPLTVRKTKEGYRLIAGARRLTAALQLGMKKVPCMVVKVTEQEAAVMTLLENLQRQRLTYWEEALGMDTLIHTFGLTPEDAAARLGLSCHALYGKLNLLSFTPWQKERMVLANLEERHARAFLKLETEEERNDCILQVIAKNLSPAQTEVLVEKRLREKEAPPPTRKTILSDFRLLQNTLEHAVTTMNRSGLLTNLAKTETETFVEYTLRVEKKAEEKQDVSAV